MPTTDSELGKIMDAKIAQAIPRPQHIINPKISLEWLIGAVIAILIPAAAVYYKVDTLTSAVQKSDSKADERDKVIQQIASDIQVQKVVIQNQQNQYQTVTQSVDILRNQVEELRRNQRWMPK